MESSVYVKNVGQLEWTKTELAVLKQEYCLKSNKELARFLERTINSIAIKAKQLGLKKSKKWTEDELKLLKECYESSDTTTLINLFPNHTLGSINKKSEQFGLKRNNIKRPRWTEEEILKLKNLVFDGKTDDEIAKILFKTNVSVKKNRRKFCREYFTWSENEINILKNNYNNKLVRDLLILLPYKTKNQIQKKANSFNLYKPDSLLWSDEEIETLKNNYPNKTIKELLIIFPDKTKIQINKKAKRLGLKKTTETLARCFNTEIGKVPMFPSKLTFWRRKILERDNFCCKDCGIKDLTGLKLQAHHIIPVRDKNCEKYDVKNGICLCINCHNKVKDREYSLIDKFKKLIGE